MKYLELSLLGRPAIRLNGDTVNELTSSKAQALLFYLAVTKQSHARGMLAALLWPDLPAERARNNLRVELYNLRQVIPEFINASRRTAAFNSEQKYELDTDIFEAYLTKKTPTVADKEAAVALYQGEFLAEFDVRESDTFESWMRNTRELLHEQALNATFDLALHYTETGNYQRGIDYLNKMLIFEPWREEVHRQMMLLLALSDRRTDALRQYELCVELLANELKAKPAAETVELYQQILEGEIHGESIIQFDIVAPEFSPRKAAPFMAPSLPAQFVGRAEMLTAVTGQLTAANSKNVVAVVGMGGVGKTTVAAHVAHTLKTEFKDGVLWAKVAHSDPQAILEQWAQAFGYDFSELATVEEQAAALHDVLADKNVLLIADDARSVTRLRPLLTSAGQRPLLVTTRNWELARSLQMSIIPLSELAPAAGQALLVNILGPERVAAEPEAAAAICTLLQNLPLAIEITAQRLKSHPRRTLTAMAARLEDTAARLAELALEDRAVRTSFEVSWVTLPDDLKRMFVRLAVFSGRPFTPPAMAYIADLDEYTAEDKLFALTDLSLLSEDKARRYYQHSLLADFAREKLTAAPWAAEPYQRMAQYFYQFATQNQRDYDALRPEWDNIMAAIETAHWQGLWQLVVDYAEVLTEPWFRRGRFYQAGHGYECAYDAALQLENEPAIAHITYQWGRAHIHQGNYPQASQLLANSLELYQALNNFPQQASVLYELAEINHEQTNLDTAHQLLEQATAALDMSESDTNSTRAKILYKLADIAYSKGRWEQAFELANNAYRNAQNVEDTIFCAHSLRLLASVKISQRDYEAAKVFITQAHALYKQLNDKKGLALALRVLGTIDFYVFLLGIQPDMGLAESYIEQSLDVSELTGDRRSQAQGLWMASRIQHALRRHSQAQQMGEQALAICRVLGDEMGQMMLLTHLGDVYRDLEEFVRARVCLQEALQLAQAYGHPTKDNIIEKLGALQQTL